MNELAPGDEYWARLRFGVRGEPTQVLKTPPKRRRRELPRWRYVARWNQQRARKRIGKL